MIFSFDMFFLLSVYTFFLLFLLCVLTSWALDKRKVVKPAPTAALRVHHCQGREHPSVREIWCVSESETPPRGGRDAVGRIRRVCSIFCCIFFYACSFIVYVCFILIFLTSSVVLLHFNKCFFLS